MMAESQQATEERLMLHMDDRLTAIAKLIRSDSQVLAGKLDAAPQFSPTEGGGGLSPADSESLRQTLRSVKRARGGPRERHVGDDGQAVPDDVGSTAQKRRQYYRRRR